MGLSASLNVQRLPGSGRDTPVLVFGHGYGCDQTMWAAVAADLPEYERILFDWPGAGRAGVAAYDARRHRLLDGYADDLLGLLAELDLRDIVFVGHSVAASISALAALREPERFGQLCMVAPSPRFANDPPRYFGGFEREDLEQLVHALADNHTSWARSIAPLVMGPHATAGETNGLAQTFCAMDPSIALIWARATFLADVRQAMQSVTTPTILLQCADDALAPVAVGDWLQQNMQRARLHLLKATGHCPHVIAPAEVAGIVRSTATWRG